MCDDLPTSWRSCFIVAFDCVELLCEHEQGTLLYSMGVKGVMNFDNVPNSRIDMDQISDN